MSYDDNNLGRETPPESHHAKIKFLYRPLEKAYQADLLTFDDLLVWFPSVVWSQMATV